MKLNESKNTLSVTFLFVILIVSMISVSFCSISSDNVISATGLVVYFPQIQVTVNPSRAIGLNNFSLGFQLDGPDIRNWRDRSVLRELASDANFKLVRFFEHRLGKPCIYWDESTKTGRWDWTSVDLLVQRIFEIGAEPLIVLGFYSWTYNRLSSAPAGMSDDPNTGLPYPDQWGAYCAEWVRHFKDVGLPVRYYEIINEVSFYFGWPATQPKLSYYMELYNASATAMRTTNPNVQVGCDSSTFKKVLDYFTSHGEDLDFLSFHRYGLDSKTKSDAQAMEAAETKYLYDSANLYGVDTARQVYKNAKGVELPVIMSEGNLCDDYDPIDQRTHTMLGAVYTALSIRTFTLKNLLHSIYFIFGGGEDEMGMVDTNTNEPWYAYYVQWMIGRNLAVGDKLVETLCSSEDMRSLAWLHGGKLRVLLICKIDQSRTIILKGVTGQLDYFKIDNTIPWETPSIQTGAMNSTDTIIMKGYSVMLLQTAE